MRPVIESPTLNAVHFLDNDPAIDARINSAQFWEAPYNDRFQEWEEQIPYLQKLLKAGYLRLQFGVNQSSDVTLQLRNCDGHTVRSFGSDVYDLPGNTEKVTGQNLHLFTHYFKPDLTTVDDGQYRFVLKVIGATETAYLVSEPVLIADQHHGTILIEGKNETNDYDYVFEQTNCTVSLVVEGALLDPDFDFDYNSYTDQKNSVTKLYAQPGASIMLHVGGIPDYLHNILNSIILCDVLRVEGNRYALDSKSKWEKKSIDLVPLRGAAISLRVPDLSRQTITYRPGNLYLFSDPADSLSGIVPPYAIASIKIGQTTANIELLNQPFLIQTQSDISVLLTLLNLSRNGLDLYGTFIATGSGTNIDPIIVSYQNGLNENYIFASVNAMPSTFTLDVIGGLVAFAINQADIIIDWGDGVVERYITGFTDVIVQHTFTGASTVQFYGSRMEKFAAPFLPYSANIFDMAGKFPYTMKLFALQGSPITNLDMNMFADTVFTLEGLYMQFGQLQTISNLGVHIFQKLKIINFSNNRLSIPAASTVINTTWGFASTGNITNGTLSVNIQTPRARPLTFTALINKSNLQTALAWAVNID